MPETWICRKRIEGEECGHLVVAESRPDPIRWSDGHVCRFEKERNDEQAEDRRDHDRG